MASTLGLASGSYAHVANPAREATISLTPSSGSVLQGDPVSIAVDFPSSGNGYSKYPLLTLEADGGTGTWIPVPGQIEKKSSSSGKFTFPYAPTVTEKVRVVSKHTESPLYAEVISPEKQLTVVVPNSDGSLGAFSADGKTVTASFLNPTPGATTTLQIQRIPTSETDEVNSTDPVKPDDATKGPWKTIKTSTQNQAGNTTFSLPSPYPYRVAHNYRALSVATTTPSVSFGLGQVTPKNSGLSAVYFNTNEGASVNTRTHYFEGEFAMTADTKGLGCSAVSTNKKSVMKGRGNYSWSFDRKSFTLKLGSSTDLCGMGKSKKWALVSNDYDKSLMRNSVAGYLGKKLTNLAWTPDSKPVDLYVNGSYRGNYLLIERIAIDTTPASPRLNLPELKGGEKTCPVGGAKTPDDQSVPSHPNNLDPCITGGYIMEWDFRKGADYNVNLGSDSGYVGIKDPENDLNREGDKTTKGISSQQKSYISSYLNTVDSNLRGSGFTNPTTGWRKYIDEASAVDYYIGMEFMKPVDGNMWASVYMYKQRDTSAGAGDGKLFFGPLWDFDLSSGMANRAGNVVSPSGFYLRNNLDTGAQQSSKTWFNRLNEDASFREAVKDRWNEIRDELQPQSFLDAQEDIIAQSASQTYSSFSHSTRYSSVQQIKSNWSADVSYLRSWVGSRKSWLNGSSGFN